ncbi:MAG TPA: extracellular solute-binding protein, partial [Coriobacteriia bacterium]|nr:extracellular solute-binding protein [Coriobacteriia bacterium]
MWTFKQSHVAALENAARGFAEETGVSVNVQAITPDETFLIKVQAAAKTGDLPDVMEVHTNGDDFTFGAAGLLADLSGDVDDAWSENYLPSVRDEGTVTQTYYDSSLTPGSKTVGIELGQRFSVPMTIGTFGIVYADKDQLAAAGITEAPATWEEFVAALDAVQKVNPETGGISLGLKSPSTGLEWFMQPMAFGLLGKAPFEALFGNDASSDWSSPAGQDVLEHYGQITPYWMPGTQSLAIDGADLAFAQGKSSFLVGGTFTLAFLTQNGYDINNVVSFPVPAPSDGAIPDLKLAPFALTGLSVSATTTNKEAALDWLKYLARPDVAASFAQDAY